MQRVKCSIIVALVLICAVSGLMDESTLCKSLSFAIKQFPEKLYRLERYVVRIAASPQDKLSNCIANTNHSFKWTLQKFDGTRETRGKLQGSILLTTPTTDLPLSAADTIAIADVFTKQGWLLDFELMLHTNRFDNPQIQKHFRWSAGSISIQGPTPIHDIYRNLTVTVDYDNKTIAPHEFRSLYLNSHLRCNPPVDAVPVEPLRWTVAAAAASSSLKPQVYQCVASVTWQHIGLQTAQTHFQVVNKSGDSFVRCMQNCWQPDPEKETVLVCERCVQQPVWKYQLGPVERQTRGPKLAIKLRNVPRGGSVTVTAFSANYSSNFILTYAATACFSCEDAAANTTETVADNRVVVFCVSNCVEAIAPGDDVVAKAVCSPACVRNLKWIVEPELPYSLQENGRVFVLTANPVSVSRVFVSVAHGAEVSNMVVFVFHAPRMTATCVRFMCTVACVEFCPPTKEMAYEWSLPDGANFTGLNEEKSQISVVPHYLFGKTTEVSVVVRNRPDTVFTFNATWSYGKREAHTHTDPEQITPSLNKKQDNCTPDSFDFIIFPNKPLRMMNHYLIIEVEPFEKLKGCATDGILQLQWIVEKLPQLKSNSNRKWSGKATFENQTAFFIFDSYKIPFEIAYDPDGWLLTVVLSVERSPTLQKHFRWWPGKITLTGGSQRRHFATRDLKLNVADDRLVFTTFTLSEKDQLARSVDWSCAPALPVVKSDKHWTVSKTMLRPTVHQCTANVSWSLASGETILNQFAQQLIYVYDAPNFYIQCLENCWNADVNKTTSLHVKCDSCIDLKWRCEIDRQLKILKFTGKLAKIPSGFFPSGSKVTFIVFSANYARASRFAIFYQKVKPKLSVVCLRNCGAAPMNNETTELAAACENPIEDATSCDGGDYSWGDPWYPPHWSRVSHVSNNRSRLTIPPFTFGDNEKPDISVFLRGLEAHWLPTPRFTAPAPVVTIRCTGNCLTRMDPAKEATLQALCHGPCTPTFLWIIERPLSVAVNTSGNETSLLTIGPIRGMAKELNLSIAAVNGRGISQPFLLHYAEIPELRVNCYQFPIASVSANDTFDPSVDLNCDARCVRKCTEQAHSFVWSLPRKRYPYWKPFPHGIIIYANAFAPHENVEVGVQPDNDKRLVHRFTLRWMKRTTNNDTVCVPTSMTLKNIPPRPLRMKIHLFKVQVEPIRQLLVCCNHSRLVWSLVEGGDRHSSRVPTFSGFVPLFSESAAIEINSMRIKAGRAYDQLGWRLRVTLKCSPPPSPATLGRSDPFVEKRFRFWPGRVRLLGGREREHYIDSNLTLSILADASKRTAFTPAESPRMSIQQHHWRCESALPLALPSATTVPVPSQALLLGDLECTINITWSQGNRSFLSQRGQQLIHVVQHPPNLFYVRCASNCRRSNVAKETVVEVQCSHCKDEEISWSYEVFDQRGNLLDEKTLGSRSKRVSITDTRFRRGTRVLYRAKWGRFSSRAAVNYLIRDPQIEIRCGTNCGENADAEKETAIIVTCTTRSDLSICDGSVANWGQTSSTGVPAKWVDRSENIAIQVPSGMEYTVFIKPNTFAEGEKLMFQVQFGDVVAELENPPTFKSSTTQLAIKCSYPWNPTKVVECEPFCDPYNPPQLIAICTPEAKCRKEYIWDFDSKFAIPNVKDNNGSTLTLNVVQIPYATVEKLITITFRVSNGAATSKPLNLTCTEIVPSFLVICKEVLPIKNSSIPQGNNANTGHFSPRNEVVCSALCRGRCERVNGYRWFLPQKPFNWYEELPVEMDVFGFPESIVRIKPNSFKSGEVTNVAAQPQGPGGDLPLVQFTINWIEPPDVEISIQVVRNTLFNPFLETELSIRCEKCSEYSIDRFEWSMPSVEFDVSSKDKTLFIVKKDTKSIIIPRKAFKNGEKVSVVATNGSSMGVAQIEFRLSPPVNLMLACRPTDSCEPCDPRRAFYIYVLCSGTCVDLDYRWSYKLSDKKDFDLTMHALHSSKDEIEISEGLFEGGDTLEHTVIVTDLNSNTSGRIRIKCKERTPKLEFVCEPTPCPENLTLWDVREPLIVYSWCEESCDHHEGVTWDITRLATEKKKNRTQILNKGTKFVVSTNTFKDGDTTTISVESNYFPSSRIQKKFKFMLPKPFLQVVCDENCDNQHDRKADPRLPIRLHVKCFVECLDLNYKWTFHQEPSHTSNVDPNNLVFTRKNKELEIKANTFKISDLVGEQFLYVYVSAQGAKESYKISLDEPKSELRIVCDSNCNPSDPRRAVNFHAECLKDCQIVIYNWDFRSSTSIFDGNWKTAISISDDRSAVEIAPGTFHSGETITVVVRTGVKSTATLEIPFRLPAPTFVLTCVGKNCGARAYPELKTRIKINCEKDCHRHCRVFWRLRIKGTTQHLLGDRDYELSDSGKHLVIKPNIMKPNQTVIVNVRFCGVRKSTRITYIQYIPRLSIQCTANCDFSPKMEVVLVASCRGDCAANITYDWHLDPHGLKDDEIDLDQDTLRIPAFSYEVGTEVLVKVHGGGGEKILKLNFSKPFWEGECELDPRNGTAGITNFTVKCWDFVHFAEMYVFQSTSAIAARRKVILKNKGLSKNNSFDESIWFEVSDEFLTNFGVLLAYGPAPVLKDILFALEYQIINVGIGFNFKLHVMRQFSVDIKPINNYKDLPYQYRQVDSDLKEKHRRIIEVTNEYIFGSNGLKLYHRTKNAFRFVQLLNVLDYEIFLTEREHILHYRKHLLKHLSAAMHFIEPMQLITLLMRMTHSNNYHELTDAPIADLIVYILIRSTKELNRRLDINETVYETKVLRGFAEAAIEIYSSLSFLLKFRTHMRAGKKYLSPDYALFSGLVSEEERENYYLHYFSSQITWGVEEAASLMYSALKLGQSSEITGPFLKLRLLSTGSSFILNEKIPLKGNKYITIKFHPLISDNLLELSGGILYVIGIFHFNLFWFNKIATDLQLPILLLSIGTVYERVKSENNLVQIMFPITQKVTTFHINFTSNAAYRFGASSGAIVLLWATNQSPNDSTYISLFGQTAQLDEVYTTIELMPNKSQSMTFRAPSDEVLLVLYTKKQATISGNLKVVKCASWDSTTWQWSRSDCLSHYHGSQQLVCRCNHLSLFGTWEKHPVLIETSTADVYLKNEIAFYDYILLQSYVAILLLFAGMFLIAVLHDRKLAQRASLVYLIDNVPGDSHMYLVVVSTGIWWNSGTTATVGIQLVGQHGKSRRHLLKGPSFGVRCLERSGNDCFVLFSPIYLGVIKRVRLWHNACGPAPHWFCERVVVQHVLSKKLYAFKVERWLSLIYGNGRLHCSVVVNLQKCHISFKMSWKQRIRQAWLNQSLDIFWLVNRPGMTFKSVERVAVLMATVSLCMLMALFLVQREEWLQIINSCYTSLATSSFEILLTTLFSKSCPRQLNEPID